MEKVTSTNRRVDSAMRGREHSAMHERHGWGQKRSQGTRPRTALAQQDVRTHSEHLHVLEDEGFPE